MTTQTLDVGYYPESPMILDKEQLDQVFKFLDERWPAPRICPICSKTEWSLSDTVMEITEHRPAVSIIGESKVMPVLSLVCQACGYVNLFSAIRVGVVKTPG